MNSSQNPPPVPDVPPLPEGTRLVHIGPHKTGTTSIQGALFEKRDELAGHGVHFPGDDRHPMHAALAATARPSMMGDAAPKEAHWLRLLRQVEDGGDRRTVISSEFFADADEAAVERVVRDLGGDRVRIVVTLRPLAKILPSQWQQYVQNGLRMGYEDWLRHMLRKAPYEQPTPSFWRRHRHAELIERWSGVVGPDRVTVIMVDDRERDMLARVFERLLDLPAGLLEPVTDAANRSLTLGEAELVREFNILFRASDLPERLYSRLIRYGAVPGMKTRWQPTEDTPRIITPEWAGRRAAEIGEEVAGRVAELGVRVVGDPAVIATAGGSVGATGGPPTLSPAVAAEALFGAVRAGGGQLMTATGTPAAGDGRMVREVTSRELVNVLAARTRRRLRRARRSQPGRD
ncbi:hypothetical protein [Streptomyces sp. NPDC050560]|uniref:hypothetical protein n=1 Tax=Streptomyces sp. NPDC050560 TaxID=3365630 RepID=UPI003797FA05